MLQTVECTHKVIELSRLLHQINMYTAVPAKLESKLYQIASFGGKFVLSRKGLFMVDFFLYAWVVDICKKNSINSTVSRRVSAILCCKKEEEQCYIPYMNSSVTGELPFLFVWFSALVMHQTPS